MEEKNEIKEVEEVTEEVKEEVKETKKEESFENSKQRPSIIKVIWNIIFWGVIIVLAFVWVFDFIQVKNDKEPKFCISNKTHTYEDGTVEECTGLGYKVYNYNRTSLNYDVQFSPFFVGMKED